MSLYKGKTTHDLQFHVLGLSTFQLNILNYLGTCEQPAFFPILAVSDELKQFAKDAADCSHSAVLLARYCRSLDQHTLQRIFSEFGHVCQNAAKMDGWHIDLNNDLIPLKKAIKEQPPAPEPEPSDSSEEDEPMTRGVYRLPDLGITYL